MINVTTEAATKIKSQLEKRGKGLGIRIGVKTTGCSGLAYILEFVDQPTEQDLMSEHNGVCIFVDPKSLPYVDGMTMAWKRQGLNEGFDFINDKEKARCGCGESFTI